MPAALLAPLTGVLPTMGATYIAKAFITVITGGAAILAGTAAGSVLLGIINGVFTFLAGPESARWRCSLAAIVLLRLMPQGITGPLLPEVAMTDGGTSCARCGSAWIWSPSSGSLFALAAPQVLQLFTIINLTTVIALAVLALSLALIWGYGGILCFGQVAFFGLGAYAYAIAAINFGGTTWAILIAVAVACASLQRCWAISCSTGAISDVYLGVITLTFTLILFSVMRRTSGPEYQIGKARLGGFNGITSPPLNVPWNSSATLFPEQVFYVAMAVLILLLPLRRLAGDDAFRPRLHRHPRERDARRTAGLRHPRLQARHLHHRRRHCRAWRRAVLQRRRPRHARRVRPLQCGAHHHLGDRRRARHARRAGDRAPSRCST